MKEEIRLYSGMPMRTLYIGGGTPSLIPEPELESLLSAVRDRFSFAPDVEMTLEANPEDITHDKARFWRSVGINRISVGVQSMHEETLRFLNRRNRPHSTRIGLQHLRDAGFDNIGVDRILSIRDDDPAAFLNLISAFRPEHVSIYHLTIAEGTLLDEKTQSGEYVPYDDDEYVRQYESAVNALVKRGYIHYEISNFAREEHFMSRHNLNYWDLGEYIGIGAGASGFLSDGDSPLNGRRRTNHTDLERYIADVTAGRIPVETEERSDKNTLIREYVMLRLRLREGLIYREFEERFGFDLQERFNAEQIDRLKKYMIFDVDRMRLSMAGIHVSNRVIATVWELAVD